MNLSRKWLNEFVTVDADDKEFAESMTLSGSKVEVTEDLGAEISNVVVGRILSMDRHPDSDHMWVCQIDVGRDEPVQIVTGAWNIHTGDLVPAALHKSTLPGGVKIEKGAVLKNCVIMQNSTIQSGANLDCVITDKDVTILADHTMGGYPTFPFVISKGQTV